MNQAIAGAEASQQTQPDINDIERGDASIELQHHMSRSLPDGQEASAGASAEEQQNTVRQHV